MLLSHDDVYIVDQLICTTSLPESSSHKRSPYFNPILENNLTHVPRPHFQSALLIWSLLLPPGRLCPRATCWTLLTWCAGARQELSLLQVVRAHAKSTSHEFLGTFIHEPLSKGATRALRSQSLPLKNCIWYECLGKPYCSHTILSAAFFVSQTQTLPSVSTLTFATIVPFHCTPFQTFLLLQSGTCLDLGNRRLVPSTLMSPRNRYLPQLKPPVKASNIEPSPPPIRPSQPFWNASSAIRNVNKLCLKNNKEIIITQNDLLQLSLNYSIS